MSVAADPRESVEAAPWSAADGFRAPYRPELEGLRAVAILLVAASHLWWGRISGGIDVFLVVSGYLITVTLVIRWVRTGSVAPARYLRSLAARLIPAALLVLGTIAVVSWLVLAETRPSLASDVLRSTGWAALFGQNWYLAIATDGYLSADRLLNPAEHFWALSMQVQFYLVWLALVALLALGLRRGGSPARRLRMATTAIAAVTLASWAWSVVTTLRDQPLAYLDTSARIWEFGVGGLLALLGARLVPRPFWGAVLGWVGLAMVIGLGFLGDFDPWFPGIASVWPVVGTALVLVGANSATRLGAHRLLGSRPAVWLGGLAFGLYLWHWPVISALAILQNRRSFTAVEGITIVLAALIAAWVMKQVLEQPWQRWGRRVPWAAVAAAVLVAALGAGTLTASASVAPAVAAGPSLPAPVIAAPASDAGTGGRVPGGIEPVDGPEVFPDAETLHAAITASAAWTSLPPDMLAAADGQETAYGAETCVHELAWERLCEVGDPSAPYTAVIVGDSVAASWVTALTGALGPSWRVRLATEGACAVADAPAYFDGRADPAWAETCRGIRDSLLAGIRSSRPDLVVLTSSSRTLGRLISGASGEAARDEWRAGMDATLAKLRPVAPAVVVVAPPPLGVASCGSADFEPGGSRCRQAITENWRIQSFAERAAAADAGVAYIDTRDWFCTAASVCPWAADGTVLRRDTHHLSKESSGRLAAVVRTALAEAIPELPVISRG